MSVLDKAVISAKNHMFRAKENVKDFMKSEKGVSNVVATIVILLIVVLLIGIFWDRLKEWIDGIMNTIFGTGFDTEGLTEAGGGSGLGDGWDY